MQIYPAIQARMGRWQYYLVRMSMVEIAQNIRYAEEIHGASQLSDAIQRNLNKNRSTGEIARYLARHDDRFFGAIVVAALGGDPTWHPVSIEDDPKFELLGRGRLTEAFGVLTFDGTENYFALDGQHRLSAIRNLLDNETDFRPPEGFRDEEVSVLLVTPRQLEDGSEFIVRYRRLFGHLNRYAKAMSQYDNIIMDEDDPLAIITRRLVSRHPFFRSYADSEFDTGRVMMNAGKNLRSGVQYFTTLEVLYDVNVRLLLSRYRRNTGWGQNQESWSVYKKFRPAEDEIDALEVEVVTYWNALLDVLPMLNNDGSRMRDHRPPAQREDPNASQDCVLFWPIVQIMLADLARTLCDDELHRMMTDEMHILTEDQAKQALAPLARLNWDAHSPPWKHVLLVPTDETLTSWRIASEDRKGRVMLVERILRWQCGADILTTEEVHGEGGLRSTWYAYVPAVAAEAAEAMWSQIESDGLIV